MKMYFVIKFYILIIFLSDGAFSQRLDAVIPNNQKEKLNSCQLKIKEAVSKCLSDSLEKICEEKYSDESVSKDSENSYSSISSISSSSPFDVKKFDWSNNSPLAKPSDFYPKEKKTFNPPRAQSSIKTKDETLERFSSKLSDNTESLRPRVTDKIASTSLKMDNSDRKNNGDVIISTTIPKLDVKKEIKKLPSGENLKIRWKRENGQWINYVSTDTNKKY
ncbi:uncharacterized protein [Chelonus insularis]|uniref:uncharacterized protein n=1 Tax=Chelonus insularis TaxID=460826 RepID=UPI00158884A5|nr:uncharacterized protein LOC118074793 [Chelonus insularis]